MENIEENPEPTNDERAARASQAIEQYQKILGYEDDPQSIAGDLITDLMHFARQEGWDFERIMTTAEVNFNEEVDEEEGEEVGEEEEEEEGTPQ